MGCCQSTEIDDLRWTTDLEDYGTPIGGAEFADFIIRKMRAHKQGPSRAEGEMLSYLVSQGTPADKSSTRWGTPREYAVTHRLAVWTRFIIDILRVQPPEDGQEAMRTERYADRREYWQLSSDEKFLYDDVRNSNVDPSSARFYIPEHYSRNRSNDPSPALQVEVLLKPNQQTVREDEELAARSPEEVSGEEMPEDSEVKLTLWMVGLRLGEKAAAFVLEKIGGSLLWEFFSVCMQIAKVVRKWNGREDERLAFRNFAEAHRRVIQCVKAMERFVETPGIPETDISGPPTEKMGEILARKAREIMKIVDKVREEIDKARKSTEPTHNELMDLILRQTSKLLVKRMEINFEIECMIELAKNKKRVGALEESIAEMKKEHAAFKKSDEEWKELRNIIGGGSTHDMKQRVEAMRSMMDSFAGDRARKADGLHKGGDGVEGLAAPSDAPDGADVVARAASSTARAGGVGETKRSNEGGDGVDEASSSATRAGGVGETKFSNEGGHGVVDDGVEPKREPDGGVEKPTLSDGGAASSTTGASVGETKRSDIGGDGVGGAASIAARAGEGPNVGGDGGVGETKFSNEGGDGVVDSGVDPKPEHDGGVEKPTLSDDGGAVSSIAGASVGETKRSDVG